jgi:hypothetical protein
VKAAARRSLTVAAAGSSGQGRRFRLAAVLLLLIIGIPGATSGSAIGLSDVFGATDPLSIAAPPVNDSFPAGVVADRAAVLSPAQLTRAVTGYRQLPLAQRVRFDKLLAAVPTRVQGYVLKAFAAGHPVDELVTFAALIADRDRAWLRTRLNLLDPTASGLVTFRGVRVRQYDDTSCGSTAIVLSRAIADPIYALMLTTGGHPGTADESADRFRARLKAEEQRVHRATNLLWPALVGTPPWGLRDLMNEPGMGLGAQYRWTVTAQWVTAGPVAAVVRQALAAVTAGYPVPVLIGDTIPRHYVLLVHYDAAGALFYEPTAGEVRRVSPVSLHRLDFSVLGYAHLHGVIMPL